MLKTATPHAQTLGQSQSLNLGQPQSQAKPLPKPLTKKVLLALALPLFALGILLGTSKARAADLEQIKKQGSVKIALYKANPPFSDGTNQDPTGLDVDIAKALVQELGVKPDWMLFDSGENMADDLRNMVWKGHYLGYGPADFMMHVPVDKFFMSGNPQAFIFAPYLRERFAFLYRKSDFEFFENTADLKGKTLSTARGSAAASALFGAEQGSLTPTTKIATDGVEAADWVVQGKSSAAYVTRAEAEAVLHQAPAAEKDRYRIKEMTLPGTPPNGWPVGLAVKADNMPLAKALDAAMDKLKANGKLLEIFKQHGITIVQP